jgi:flavin reductase (DIM6/NTAB) family NADH-FMN oxidoreductase RutF
MSTSSHSIISPAILYWGTPVVLVTSENEDGTSNIAPISSAWWLGHSCIIGFDASSKTPQNILRTKECVLNLAEDTMTPHVNELAETTGSDPVSASKQQRHYKFVKDKWTKARLTPEPSDFVRPKRISECPVHMECQVLQTMSLRPDLPDLAGMIIAIELRVMRIHVADSIRMAGHANRVDPEKWHPLIMSFRQFYGLRDGQLASSVLGKGSEERYRGLTKSELNPLQGDEDDELAANNMN